MNRLSILVFFLTSILSFGQVTLKGKITTSTNDPVPNIAILLLNQQDSIQVKSGLSHSDGTFYINNVLPGSYLLSYKNNDAERKYININNVLADQDIGSIIIETEVNNLNEVIITGTKPLIESHLDKIIVNVQENLTTAGSTALEVLSRSPGVNISKERHLISLNGKSDVLIMLDGKIERLPIDALMQILDGMPAQNIKKIELIANPSAKYDAGSSGGIINIIGLKGKNLGFNGTSSFTAGYGNAENLGTTINLNYKETKFNLYSNFAYYRDNTDQTYHINREINNANEIFLNQVYTDRNPLKNYYSGKIGIDYDITKVTKIGGYILGMMDLFHLQASTDVIDIDNNGNTSYGNVLNNEKNNWSNLSGNIYLNHQLSEKQDLNFDFTYLYYYNKNNLSNLNRFYHYENNTESFERMDGIKKAPVDVIVGSIDYSNNLSENSKLELGSKFSSSYYNCDIELTKFGLIDESLEQKFTLAENIFAVYGNYNLRINNKTELQTGLRYEYFNLDSNSATGDIRRKSADLFPSVYLSHKLSELQTLQLSYNRRVSRPSYNDFAPYYVFIDPSTSFTGNENLNQAIVDGYKIDFLYSKFLFSGQYTHEGNGIARFQPQADLENNTLFYSSLNMDYRDTYTLLISFPIKIKPWWNVQNNFMGVRQNFRTKHLQDNLTFTNNYVELNSTFSFQFPKDYSADLFGFYHTAQLTGFSKNKTFGNMSIGVGKKITERQKLTLNLENILGGYKDWDIVDEQKLHYSFNSQYNLSPFTIRLTYSYIFGGEGKNSRKRGAGSEDVENRIR